jgi:hypothetical protein
MGQQQGGYRSSMVGSCYICDKMRHIARDCSQRRQQQQRRDPRTQQPFMLRRGIDSNQNNRGVPPKSSSRPPNRFYQVNGLSNALVVEGTVNGILCECLIDTGTSVSVLPLPMLGSKQARPSFNNVELPAVNGTRLDVLGEVQLIVGLQHWQAPHRFLVVDTSIHGLY